MKWRANKFLTVMGRLKPGATAASAEKDLTAILRRAPGEPPDVRVQLIPLKDDLSAAFMFNCRSSWPQPRWYC